MYVNFSLEEVAKALASAVDKDLKPFEFGGGIEERPRTEDCLVYIFPQVWDSAALGFIGDCGRQIMTTAYTVVVEGRCGEVCVYFAGRFAYRVERTNFKFWQDIQRWSMCAVGKEGQYTDYRKA